MSETDNKVPIQERISDWFSENSLPLKLFFISRAGLFLLVYLSLILIPVKTGEGLWRSHPQNLVIDGWSRWDSGWYRSISELGYTNDQPHMGVDTAFFPMYPIVMRLTSEVTGDTDLAGILVSNAAFLAALIVLFKLLTLKHDPTITERTLTLISFGAFSFFFSAVYTESLFLLAVVCAFYFGEQRKYLWAALWAAVASATRLVGVILVVPLLLMYLEQTGYDWRKIKPRTIFIFSLFALGALAFMAYLGLIFGDPLQFVASQEQWAPIDPFANIAPALQSLSFRSILAGNFALMNVIHILIAIAAVLLALAYRKQVGVPYTFFSILVIAISASLLHGMGRYLLVAFPLFIATAYFLKNRDLYQTFLYISILLLSLFSVMFSHWYWVA